VNDPNGNKDATKSSQITQTLPVNGMNSHSDETILSTETEKEKVRAFIIHM